MCKTILKTVLAMNNFYFWTKYMNSNTSNHSCLFVTIFKRFQSLEFFTLKLTNRQELGTLLLLINTPRFQGNFWAVLHVFETYWMA